MKMNHSFNRTGQSEAGAYLVALLAKSDRSTHIDGRVLPGFAQTSK